MSRLDSMSDGFYEEVNFNNEKAPAVVGQELEPEPEPKEDEGSEEIEIIETEEKETEEHEGEEHGGEEEEEEPLQGQSKEANRAFREMRKALEELKRENAELRARDEEKERIAQEVQRRREVDDQYAKLNKLREQLKIAPQKVYEGAVAEGIHEAIAKTMAATAELKLTTAIMREEASIKQKQESAKEQELARISFLNAKAEEFMRDHDKLRDKYGELVPELDQLDDGTKNRMKSGSSLYDAFVAEHEDELFSTKVKDAQRQGEVIAKSKNHIKAEKAGGQAGAVKVPPDIVRLYRQFNNTWSEAQIYKMWKEDEANKRKKG